ncbi:hypothetical protein GCM10010145_22490 [Streptomyces ruber]|uniref:SnoaL-like domain-containing protein n=2 Tax=Streptomyces TaxID=1883 RepID=A0A918BAB1_9ACTN|nr:nuclear transport factor 2 family protein [Streptomyces ruber]GGQ52551.1 hypothetical protein GCM10010145_22490 [Streptomyces ruber]
MTQDTRDTWDGRDGQDGQDVVRRYLKALNDRDGDTLMAMIAPDAVFTIPGDHPLAGTWRGLPEIVERFMLPMGGLFAPDAPYVTEVTGTVAEGDRVVVFCTSRATTRGGEPYTMDAAVLFTVRDGRIAGMREYFDTQYFTHMLFRDPAGPGHVAGP